MTGPSESAVVVASARGAGAGVARDDDIARVADASPPPPPRLIPRPRAYPGTRGVERGARERVERRVERRGGTLPRVVVVVVDVDVEPHEQLGRARGHVQVLVQLSPRREHAVVLPHGEAIGDTGLEHRAHARGRLRVRREERLRVENLRGRIARHGLVRRRRRDRLPRVRGHPRRTCCGFYTASIRRRRPSRNGCAATREATCCSISPATAATSF